MMLSAASGTIEMRPSVVIHGNREPLINQAYRADAPWQFTVLRKLHDLSSLSTVGEQGSAMTPASSAFDFARLAIAQVSGVALPSPVVCPVSGGSIGMIWSLGPKQLEVIFDADHAGSYVLSKGDEVIEDGEIAMSSQQPLQFALVNFLRA